MDDIRPLAFLEIYYRSQVPRIQISKFHTRPYESFQEEVLLIFVTLQYVCIWRVMFF